MPDTPSSKLPALFVRLPVATHDLLRDLAATADESVSRYIVTLIEQQRVGGPQLPPRRPRKVVAPPPVEEHVEEPVRRKRGRPRKLVTLQPPVEVSHERFCACGRRVSECDGSRKGCPPVALPQVEQPPRRPRGRPRKVPAEVVATPPHKRTPRVEAAPVQEPAITAADIGQLVVNAVRLASPSIPDTLDRIRAALARLEEPPVEELADESASRVVVEDAP
jgi:hypothetical protein